MATKKILVLSDLHIGSTAGLVPEAEQTNDAQAQFSEWFFSGVNGRKWDAVIVNGDLIDGEAKKDAGRGLWTTSMTKQAKWCGEVLNRLKTDHIYLTRGTGYHVASGASEMEDLVIDYLNHKNKVIKDSLLISVAEKTVYCKHHAGSSCIPHGLYTSASREALWAGIEAQQAGQPNPDLTIVSHIHKYAFMQTSYQTVLRTPAMVLMGREDAGPYNRKCSGVVDTGYCVVQIANNQIYVEPRLVEKHNSTVTHIVQ